MRTLSMGPSPEGARWNDHVPADDLRCVAEDACPRCASVCASCGRSASERGHQPVLCDGLCRDCVEWDYLFDAAEGAWLIVDRHGECDDCTRDAALVSIGDGLVCIECWLVVRKRRAAA
jgi:hypothetical protein